MRFRLPLLLLALPGLAPAAAARPHNPRCAPDARHLYLARMGAPKRRTIVDPARHKKIGEVRFSSVVRPIALTPDEKRLFAEVDGLVGIERADLASRKMVRR